eukprot:583351_1
MDKRRRDKKKNQQTTYAILGGLSALVVVGFVAYWYSASPQKDETEQKEQEEDPNKIEQITYAGDDDDMEDALPVDSKPLGRDIQEESKSIEEDPEVARNDVQDKPSTLIVPDDAKEVETTDTSDTKPIEEEPPQPVSQEVVTQTETTEPKPQVSQPDQNPTETTDNAQPITASEDVKPNENQETQAQLASVETDKPPADSMTVSEDAKDKETEAAASTVPKEESPVIVHKEEAPPASFKEKKEEPKADETEEKTEAVADEESEGKKFEYKNGKLRIKLIKAVDVNKDLNRRKQCCVVMEVVAENFTHENTSTVKKVSNNVEWNEEFVMNVQDALKDVLVLRLMENQKKNKNKEYGFVEIKVVDVVGAENASVVNKEYQVVKTGKSGKCYSKMYVNITYTEDKVQQK